MGGRAYGPGREEKNEMAKDYRAMVKKLLALAKSPNENEAKAALLKARQIMAEHKLGETECLDPERVNVKKGLSGISCTKRKDSWVTTIAATIAENYCCTSYRSHKAGGQKNEIGFIGLEQDYDICTMVFRYAVETVRSREEEIWKEYRGILIPEYIRKSCEAYGFGFADGLEKMYRRQTKENTGWALVMVVPKEVEEAGKGLRPGTAFAQVNDEMSIYEQEAAREGQEAGENFRPERRLETA